MDRRPNIHRGLLLADMLSEDGMAEAADVADVLAAWWSRPGAHPGADLEERLRVALSLDDAAWQVATARVDAALASNAGDARRALTLRGGLDHAIHVHLATAAPAASCALTADGVGVRWTLRTLREGRYRSFLPVGEGGMGFVYEARDVDLHRPVAFKIVRPPGGDFGNDVTPAVPLALAAPPESSEHAPALDGLRARFLQEAWITSALEHPGIVPVYEIGQTEGGIPYYTMRLVRGSRTLADALADVAHAPLEKRLELLDTFLDLCDIVRYAHSRGVIHRDLKPSNVALGEYGEVVVLDWGLAKLTGGGELTDDEWRATMNAFREDSALRTLASAVGTPGYMAPEAAQGRIDAMDAQSDVFQLGVIFFEILAGRLPFDATSLASYAEALEQPAPDLAAAAPGLPKGLAAIAHRALALEPADRFASIESLSDALRAWRSEVFLDQETTRLRDRAESALEAATHARDETRADHLDRAVAAIDGIVSRRPEDPTVPGLTARVVALRQDGERRVLGSARRRLLARVGVTAAVVLAVAGTLVALVLESRRQEAERARAHAVATRARAESVMAYMVDDLHGGLAAVGRLDLVADATRQAATYYQELAAATPSEASLRNHVRALINLGEVHEGRGHSAEAWAAYTQASDVAASLERQSAGAPYAAGLRMRTRAKANAVRLRQGHAIEPLQAFEGYARAIEVLLEQAPARADLREALSEAYAFLGDAHRMSGDWTRGLECRRTALVAAEEVAALQPLDMRARLLPPKRAIELAAATAQTGGRKAALAVIAAVELPAEPPEGDMRVRLVAAQRETTHGDVLAELRRFAEALAAYRSAYEVLSPLVMQSPSNRSWRARLVGVRRRMGDMDERLRGNGVAVDTYSAALADIRLLTKADPANARWSNQHATLLDRVARGVRMRGDSHVAVIALRQEAVAVASAVLVRDPENAHWRHIQAYTQAELTYDIIRKHGASGARTELERAIELGTAVHALKPLDVEVMDMVLGLRRERRSLAWLAGDRAGGIADLEASQALVERMLMRRPDSWRMALERIRLLAEWAQQGSVGASAEEAAGHRATARRELALLQSSHPSRTVRKEAARFLRALDGGPDRPPR